MAGRSALLPILAASAWLWASSAWAGASVVLADRDIDSPALGRPLSYTLYLPPGYAAGGPPVAVVYLLHGTDSAGGEWITEGGAQATADRLAAAGRIIPMILVMPDAGNSWYVDSRGRGGPGDYASALIDDLLPAIDRRYRTSAERSGRGIAGISMGGFGALRLALAHPDRFAAAASLSGAFWLGHDQRTVPPAVIGRIFQGAFGTPFDRAQFLAESPLGELAGFRAAGLRLALYLTAGRQDQFATDREAAELADALRAGGAPATLALTAGGHDWATWTPALADVLLFLSSALRPQG